MILGVGQAVLFRGLGVPSWGVSSHWVYCLASLEQVFTLSDLAWGQMMWSNDGDLSHFLVLLWISFSFPFLSPFCFF